MASVTTIPGFNVKASTNTIGPAQPGSGLSNIIIQFEAAAFSANTGETLSIGFDESEDGVNWQFMGSANWVAPVVSRGVSQNTLRIALNFGSNASGPILSTANTRVRSVISSSVAFHSNGGTLTVY